MWLSRQHTGQYRCRDHGCRCSPACCRLDFVRLTSLPLHALLLLSPSPVAVSSDRLLGRQPGVRSGAKPHGVARALCLLGLGSQGGGDSTLALELQAIRTRCQGGRAWTARPGVSSRLRDTKPDLIHLQKSLASGNPAAFNGVLFVPMLVKGTRGSSRRHKGENGLDETM